MSAPQGWVLDPWSEGSEAKWACFCACHEYPGTYPTGPDKPCCYCGHIHEDGSMLGRMADGWTPTRADDVEES